MLKKKLNALWLLAALGFSAPAMSTNIVIVNTDPPGVGFNDPTPVAPVGGNPGTTLGQQRLNVFAFSANVWASTVDSTPDILVDASFAPLACTPTSGTLGSAGPTFVADFDPGTEPPGTVPDTSYVISQFNAIVGTDILIPVFGPGTPHLGASFNGDIGVNPNCLTGFNWYNGLDGNNGPGEFDLLAVVTHEIGHGLGFLELVSTATGNFFLNQPDIYSTFLLDLSTGLFWDEMTSAERLVSTVNDGNLVFAGAKVTSDAGDFLGPRPSVRIFLPRSLTGSEEVQQASFGPSLTGGGGLAGRIVQVNDGTGVSEDGCEPLTNIVRGRIALIQRGACAFVTKALNAQAAGARGVIIYNNLPAGRAPVGGTSSAVTIPTVGVTKDLGEALRDAPVAAGTLVLDASILAGTSDGLVRVYAPPVAAGGSSTSHFDVTLTPNALMEPFITDSLAPLNRDGLDLTDSLFEDLGWPLFPE